MAKKIGVCLSGCGVMDGSEIHEAVLTLLAIDKAGADAVCMAPDTEQMHVIDHVKNQPAEGENRNVLTESARIARGEIKPLENVHAADIDAIVFPGGFGAAKNLCTFAVDGPDCTVKPEVERIMKEMSDSGKPIGVMCIAPVIAAKVLGSKKVVLTIGTDAETAGALEKMGARHKDCPVEQTVVDKENKVVSTPAYMLASGPADMADAIDKLVKEVIAMS
jgi:enhancing lycopene biosynthesis protein 2